MAPIAARQGARQHGALVVLEFLIDVSGIDCSADRFCVHLFEIDDAHSFDSVERGKTCRERPAQFG